ncbi:DUF427 domain-containing protein [Streptomyces sp. NPDC005386]|uniref:DUF427 domain-containing protein n=1 Tax=Streptomyces sp. NPDC005386 TaxID=3154562 RepID=UPI0033B0A00C
MGLAWQQGPLAPGAIGTFLTPAPLPERLLFAERLRRRMRVRFGGAWIADSENVVVLHEPDRYPVAYFPLEDVTPAVLEPERPVTRHRDLGATSWYTARCGNYHRKRAAWRHVSLPDHAAALEGRVAFAWRAMDAFYEEDQRILGHAADAYHRIDLRRTSRHLEVRDGNRTVADSSRPTVLYESGFAPRWYVPRHDIDLTALVPASMRTFCPYKGVAHYYDIGDAAKAAWSYPDAYPEVAMVSGMVSFEPNQVAVFLDGERLAHEPGQVVVPHGIDRGLDVEEPQGS